MFWSFTSGKDVIIEKSGILVTFDTPLAEYMDKHSYTQMMQQHPNKAWYIASLISSVVSRISPPTPPQEIENHHQPL